MKFIELEVLITPIITNSEIIHQVVILVALLLIGMAPILQPLQQLIHILIFKWVQLLFEMSLQLSDKMLEKSERL